MTKYSFKYGKGIMDVELDENNVLKVIEPNVIEETTLSDDEVIKNALANPIDVPRIKDSVKAGDKVAIAVGDKTRLWQNIPLILKYVLEEVEGAGVAKEDITIISGVGSHPAQSDEELIAAVGKEVFNSYRIIENQCKNEENFVRLGVTRRGTPVEFNKAAYEADYLILIGGIVYHFLAGYGGGRKMILPGLCSANTIFANHALAFNPGFGNGSNPNVKCGDMSENNPLADDMIEAAKMAKPDFIINVIANSKGKITHAFAGDFIEAHKLGTKVIDERDGVKVDELADMVITSPGGYPKDINIYQAVKPLINGIECIKKGGVAILVDEAADGIGNPDLEHMLLNCDTTAEREKVLRDNYTTGRHIAYKLCEYADNYVFILVSGLAPELFAKTNIKVVKTIKEAVELAYSIKGTRDLKTYLMPAGGNTFPLVK